jgi:hypothetical protein
MHPRDRGKLIQGAGRREGVFRSGDAGAFPGLRGNGLGIRGMAVEASRGCGITAGRGSYAVVEAGQSQSISKQE